MHTAKKISKTFKGIFLVTEAYKVQREHDLGFCLFSYVNRKK